MKALYNDLGVIELDDGLVLRYSNSFIPNTEDVTRWFKSTTDNELQDKVADNDAPLLLPTTSIDATTTIEFDDLTGVTITSYTGDQVLSISGNNIVSSGEGIVNDIYLSNGLYIPLLNLKYGYIDNVIQELTVSGTAEQSYDVNGSEWLQRKGAVEKSDDSIIQTSPMVQQPTTSKKEIQR